MEAALPSRPRARGGTLPHLLETQEKDGRWVPKGAGPDTGYADYLSEADATAIALLSLECCYRYVPKPMLR